MTMTPPSQQFVQRSRRPRRSVTWVLRISRVLALIYLLCLPALYLLQDILIFPGSFMPSMMTRFEPPPGSKPLSLTTSEGVIIGGLMLRAFDPSGKPVNNPRDYPTILYFYGNGSSVAQSKYELDLFRRCEANVLVADYPGYSMSSGKISERSCYETAEALWKLSQSSPDIDPSRVHAVGWSLGGAVAIDLSQRHRLRSVTAINTFTNLQAMGRHTFAFLPSRMLLRYRFDSIRKMPAIGSPVWLLHAEEDEIIPPEMSRTLARHARPGRVHFELVPYAHHNDVFLLGHDQIEHTIRRAIGTAGGENP